MGCMVESPEESYYFPNATKYPAYNMPNSTETSLKPSGTKSFGVMRPKFCFLATGEESTRPMMNGTEVDR